MRGADHHRAPRGARSGAQGKLRRWIPDAPRRGVAPARDESRASRWSMDAPTAPSGHDTGPERAAADVYDPHQEGERDKQHQAGVALVDAAPGDEHARALLVTFDAD